MTQRGQVLFQLNNFKNDYKEPKKLSQTLYFIKLDSSPEDSFSKYKLHKKKDKICS